MVHRWDLISASLVFLTGSCFIYLVKFDQIHVNHKLKLEKELLLNFHTDMTCRGQ